MSTRLNNSTKKANALTPPKPAQVRTSRDRAESIKQYIEGLLPSDLAAEVDVVITEHVATAAVMPATEDALLDGDKTDFDRQQAKQLIDRVDGEYLVLITGREATTDSICLSDQLTADTAHQFGLAFHETLHILKTSFGAVQTLVETEIDEQYREFLHELINIAEDGAIEHEAQTGDDFTERAGNRLTLVRQMHSQTVDELPAEKREFTFGEALVKALFDKLIFDTEVTDALRDDSDTRVTFASESGREAFTDIYNEIETLRDDILSLRSDHSDRLYEDDREASIQRAKRVIAFWQDVLKPLYEDGESQSQQPQQGGQQQGSKQQSGQQGQSQSQQPQQEPDGDTPEQEDASEPDANSDKGGQAPADTTDEDSDSDFDCPECDDSFDSDHGRRVHYGQQHGDTDDLDDQLENTDESTGADNADAGDIDPNDLSLNTDNIDDPFQSVQSHPSLGDEPDPDDVDAKPQPAPENSPPSTDNPAEKNDTDNSGTDGVSPDGLTPDENSGDDNQRGDNKTDTPADGNSESESKSESGTTPDSHGLGDESTQQNAGDQPADSTDTSTDNQNGQQESETGGSGDGSDVTTTSSSASTTDLASHTSESDPDDSGQQATFGDFADNGPDDSASEPDADTNSDGGDHTEASEGETGPANESSPDTGETPDDSTDPAGDSTEAETGDTQDDDNLDFDPTSSSSGQAPPTPTDNAGNDAPAEASTTDSSSTDAASTDTSTDTGTQRDDGSPETASDRDNTTDPPPGPAHDDADLKPEDFASDRNRAKRTADRSTVDEQGLAEDLQTLEAALGDEQETAPDNTQQGNGAGPGSVDELTILPEPDSSEQSDSWDSVETAADTVADTLAKELRLDQQTDTRSGLSAGTTVNTKTAYRLGHNDPRTFTESLPGDEKEYFVVIVLDRSGSMAPGYNEPAGKIDIATSAVARFAVACEDLDIDVAIIDFYDNEARYIKPPSVETEFAQESILNTDTEGRTPLADALSLARSVADADSKESLIISITDDRPNDVEAVENQIKSSYSPICSLTIATDCEYGNPPAQAETLEQMYDQTTTVYEPSKLDDRIDELASLLGAY
jgi:Mg-chelatase subunit ChlD